MSWVTQLLVYPGGLFEDNELRFFESELDRFFTAKGEERPLSIEDERLPTNWYSGGKMFGDLYIGAYNYFPLQEFLEFLQGISWDDPEFKNIQVMVGGDVEYDGMDFRVIKITYEDKVEE